MEYTTYNFSLYQGNDTDLVFTFYALDKEQQKVFTDFSGSNLIMTVKYAKQQDIIDELSLENGRIEVGKLNEDGSFTINVDRPSSIKLIFPHDIILSYDAPKLVYDLFRIVHEKHELLLHGTINMIRGVSYE